MLLRFGVKNHRSLRDYQELSMIATKLKGDESGLIRQLDEDVEPSLMERTSKVLPVAALYGANASGKSTLLQAMNFLARFIVTSQTLTSSQEGINNQPFLLDDHSRNEGSTYDVDFILAGVRYHYGFEVNRKKVLSEWLYSFPIGASRTVRSIMFHRDSNEEDEFHFGKSLKGENRQISKLVRPNSLFLSAAAQNSHSQLKEIHEFFEKCVTFRFQGRDNLPDHLLAYFGSNESRREQALQFLRSADIGVSGIDFSKVKVDEKVQKFSKDLEGLLGAYFEGKPISLSREERDDVKLIHAGAEGKNYPLPIQFESAGTTSLLEMLGPILDRLSSGGILIIDELNSTLHPLITRKLVGLFSSPKWNLKGAQLIFSTHDTNILNGGSLRRDQIWFAEKDGTGGSHVYAMSELKVRAQDDLEMGYLSGRFGAVPFGGLFDIFGE